MIVTFYSYKGGVGRSMAMASVAYVLAQRGLKVLTIDFDLEAPGLERYFFDEPVQLRDVRGRRGLLDLILDYRRALTSPTEFNRAEFKDLSRYIVEAIPYLGGGEGRVDLISAGRRYPDEHLAAYALAVRSFNWQDFFDNWRGDRFFAWLCDELTSAERGYDLVLVDSRTGVTEMGGVCAYQLADVAVLMCAANYQNLDGTSAIVRDFRSDAVVALRQGRPLELVVVPARVEDSSQELKAERERFFAEAEAEFGIDGLPRALADAGLTYRKLALPYEPKLAIYERLPDAETLTRSGVVTLTDALTLLGSGPRWDELKERSQARLKANDRSTVAFSADVTKRGAGFDAYLYCGPDDLDSAAELRRELEARGANIGTPADDSTGGSIETSDRQLAYSTTVLFCLGRSEPGARAWDVLGYAARRRKPVIPVVIRGGNASPELLARLGLKEPEVVDVRAGVAAASEAVTNLYRRLLATTVDRSSPDYGTNKSDTAVEPYPGARAFQEGDEPMFVGRSDDLARLRDAFATHRVVLLDGAPGIGKTSLVQAGLIPVVRRGEEPFSVGASSKPWTIRPLDVRELITSAELTVTTESDASPQLLILDHLDSFWPGPPEDSWDRRQRAVTELLARVRTEDRVLLVWRGVVQPNLREQAIAEWSRRHGALGIVDLLPLSLDMLRQAVERPATMAGHLFEPGVVDRLIADSGGGVGAVAQVQRALADMWPQRRRGWVTNKAYESGGGILGRFEARAAAVLSEADAALAKPTRILLLALVHVDALLRVVPDVREWSSLATITALGGEQAGRIRDRLIDARIIDCWDHDERGLVCSLAHPFPGATIESLAQYDAQFLIWRNRFASYVAEFASGRAALLSPQALSEALVRVAGRLEELTSAEADLINRSVSAKKAAEDAADADQLARARRSILLKAGGSFGLAVIALVGGFLYLDTKARRENAAAIEAAIKGTEGRYVVALENSEKARAEADALSLQVQQAQQALNSSSTSSDDLKRERDELLKQYTDARDAVTRAERALAAARQPALDQSDRPALVTQLDEQQKTIKSLTAQRDQLQDQVQRLTAANSQGPGAVTAAEWQRRATASESQVSMLRSQLAQVAEANERQTLGLVAQEMRIGDDNVLLLRMWPFRGAVGIHVGDIDDDGTPVTVLADNLIPRGNDVKERAIRDSTKGRCFADATLGMKGNRSLYFRYYEYMYELRLVDMKSLIGDQYVVFDLIRAKGGTPTRKNCTSPPSSGN